MKFTASFAVLAVFVSQAVVSAAPAPVQFDGAVEARADLVDGALDDVWSRFYDELLEEAEARGFDDEDLFERAPMKKFAQDLAVGLAQKAPTYANQYSQSQQAKVRNSMPRMATVAHKATQAAKQSVPKPLPASSKWNTVKKPSVMAEIKKLGKPSSIANQAKGAFRTRDLEFDEDVFERDFELDEDAFERDLEFEEDVFERAPMKKFAQDLATGLAQKAPTYAKQYTQSQEAKVRNQNRTPAFANVAQQAHKQSKPSSGGAKPLPASSKWNTVKKPSVMAEIKKLGRPSSIANQAKGGFRTRDLEFDEEVFERSPMKKFAQDLATGLAQKAPTYAKQYTQSQESKTRSQNRTPAFAHVAPQATQQNKTGGSSLPKIPASSKWNTVKKPSVMAEIKKLRN